MGFFSRIREQSRNCQQCGTSFRGVPDAYQYCGSCMERARDNSTGSESAQIAAALKKRAKNF